MHMNTDELKSELEQLKDEKYKLLKLINHDIRSPFNRVFALLQLIEMEGNEFSENQKEYINSMYLSILGGLEMITNLRDMREIDAGNIHMENQQFDLISIIERAIRSYSKQLEIKSLSVKTEFEIEDAPVDLDEYYVQRAIENVLSNAVKFSRKETEIFTWLRAENDTYYLEIKDEGVGILEQEAQLLFDKFKTLSSSSTGGEGGLGLGLHNTLYFLDKMNSKIHYKKNGNSGSIFTIEFPAG